MSCLALRIISDLNKDNSLKETFTHFEFDIVFVFLRDVLLIPWVISCVSELLAFSNRQKSVRYDVALW